MFIFLILGHNITGDQMKLDVKSVLRDLTVFELLHFVGLFQPALQDSTHALDSTLGQLVSPTFVIIYSPASPPASHTHTHTHTHTCTHTHTHTHCSNIGKFHGRHFL